MAEEDIYHTYILQARYDLESDSFTVISKDIEGYTGEIKNLREAEAETRPGLADMLILNYHNQGEALPKPTHPGPVSNWTLNFPVGITFDDLKRARERHPRRHGPGAALNG